jgi:hypothetical protein
MNFAVVLKKRAHALKHRSRKEAYDEGSARKPHYGNRRGTVFVGLLSLLAGRWNVWNN